METTNDISNNKKNINNLNNLPYHNLINVALQMTDLSPLPFYYDSNNIISGFSNFVNIFKNHTTEEAYLNSLSNSLNALSDPSKYSYYIHKLSKNSEKSFIIAPITTKPNMSSCIIYKSDSNTFTVVFSEKKDSVSRTYTKYQIPSTNIKSIFDYLGYGKKQNASIHEFSLELEIASVASKNIDIKLSATDLEVNSPLMELESIINFSYSKAFKKDYENNIVEGPIPTKDIHLEFLNNIKKEFNNLPVNKIIENEISLSDIGSKSKNVLQDMAHNQFNATMDSMMHSYTINKNFFDTKLYLDTSNEYILDEHGKQDIYTLKNSYSSCFTYDNKNILKDELSCLSFDNLMNNYAFFHLLCHEQGLNEHLKSIKKLHNYYTALKNNEFPSLEDLQQNLLNPAINYHNPDVKSCFRVAVDDFCRICSKHYLELALNAVINKDYELANNIYDFLIEQFPYDPNFLFERGKLYETLGMHNKALLDFKSVVTLDPNFIDKIRHNAIDLACSGEKEKAIEECNKLLYIFSNDISTQKLKDYISSIDILSNSSEIFYNAMSTLSNAQTNFENSLDFSTNTPLFSPIKKSNSSFSLNSSVLDDLDSPSSLYSFVSDVSPTTPNSASSLTKSNSLNNLLSISPKKNKNEYLLKLTDDQIEQQALQILGYTSVPNNIDKLEFMTYFTNLRNVFKNNLNELSETCRENFLSSIDISLNCLNSPDNYSDEIKKLTVNTDDSSFIVAPIFHNSSWSNVIIYPPENNIYNIVVLAKDTNSNLRYLSYNINASNMDNFCKYLGYGYNRNLPIDDFSNFLNKNANLVGELECTSSDIEPNNNFTAFRNTLNFAYSNSKYSRALNLIYAAIENLEIMDDNINDFYELDRLKQYSKKELRQMYKNYRMLQHNIECPVDSIDLQDDLINNIMSQKSELLNDLDNFVDIRIMNSNFRDHMSHEFNEKNSINFDTAEKIFNDSFSSPPSNSLVDKINSVDSRTLFENYDFFIKLFEKNDMNSHIKKLETLKSVFDETYYKLAHKKNKLEIDSPVDLMDYFYKLSAITSIHNDIDAGLINPDSVSFNHIVYDNPLVTCINDCEAYFSAATSSLCDLYNQLALNKTNKLNNMTLSGNPPYSKVSKMIDNLDVAVKLMPHNTYTLSKRGFLLALNGERERSLNDFLTATNLEPNNISIRQEYATSLYLLGKKQEALLECDKILYIDSNYVQAKELKNQFDLDSLELPFLLKKNTTIGKNLIHSSKSDISNAIKISTGNEKTIKNKIISQNDSIDKPSIGNTTHKLIPPAIDTKKIPKNMINKNKPNILGKI